MKLLKILKMLPAAEYMAFEDYLKNDLFNKRQDVIRLFRMSRKWEKGEVDAVSCYLGVYPDQKIFNKKNWHLLCSRLLKILEDYFSHRQLRQFHVEKKMFLADFYRKENSIRQYQNAIKEAGHALTKSAYRSGNFWLQKHRIEETNYDYIESQNRTERTNLQAVSDTLDVFFMISKLKLGCRQLSRAVINAEDYKIALLDFVLSNIEKDPALLAIPAIAVYYYCYRAVAPESSEKDFQNLRKIINENTEFFPPAELRDIYLIAINYCVRKINMGFRQFNKEAFELYRFSLQRGLLLEDGIFPESTYNNIVSLAIDEVAYEWAKEFIDDYQNRLEAKFRTSMHSYCSGKILFAQHKYDECLKTLALTSANIPFIYLGSKTIQLKIFYENKAWDALDSLIDSLRVYIQRRKDLGYRKTNYLNLISFSKRLLQINVLSKSEKEQLRKDILAAEIFTEKEWFLEKI